MAVALIVAAGRGERLGLDRPKALATLAGKAMIAWSVDALWSVAAVQQIVIALPPGELEAAPAGTVAVLGGATRSASVRAALRIAADGDPVIVHDAARPLVTPRLFVQALAALDGSGADAVTTAIPVSDTIKEVDEDRTVTATLERSRLWAVQTPQVFSREALEGAFSDTPDEVLDVATDDAWLVERRGGVVRVVPSDPTNIKVTTPFDLRFAELLLSERGR